jgi:hypothetical protein
MMSRDDEALIWKGLFRGAVLKGTLIRKRLGMTSHDDES